MINLNHAVQFQRTLWLDQLTKARTIVDATVGNGHDLLYLANHCQKGTTLYGLDRQAIAIEASKQRVTKECQRQDINCHFIEGRHEILLSDTPWLAAPIDLLIFNLGYLPGSSHELMTQPTTTIEAINQGLTHLAPRGLITIVAYPGTPTGEAEAQAVHTLLTTLPQQAYDVATWMPINQINKPPILYIIKGR